jgi:hypothetical protein
METTIPEELMFARILDFVCFLQTNLFNLFKIFSLFSPKPLVFKDTRLVESLVVLAIVELERREQCKIGTKKTRRNKANDEIIRNLACIA